MSFINDRTRPANITRRIIAEEKINQYEKLAKDELRATHIAQWNAKDFEGRRAMKERTIAATMSMLTDRALLRSRSERLRQKLEQEKAMYEMELAQLGLTFYPSED